MTIRASSPLDIIQEYEPKNKHFRIIVEYHNHGDPNIPIRHRVAKTHGTVIMDTLLAFVEVVGDDFDVIIGKYSEGKIDNGTNIKGASITTGPILSTFAPHKIYRWAMLNQYDVSLPDSSNISIEEDQVFDMKSYFVPNKISLLMAKDYHYWNQQEDFGNLDNIDRLFNRSYSIVIGIIRLHTNKH